MPALRRSRKGQSPIARWWLDQRALLADRRARRLTQLYAGLTLYGVCMAMMVHARLGLDPWDVLHQGLAPHLQIRFGTVVIVVGVAVLALWIPLRQAPGFGTVSNAIVIGLVTDIAMPIIPDAHGLATQLPLLTAAVIGNGIATGCYIGAGLGPGPRDGLMTGIAARGHSIRLVRTGLELTVLVSGWLLGGSVGLGTVMFALSIGPLAHVTIPAFAIGSTRVDAHPVGQPLPDVAA
jgi:uncharacterized membrane protein YczE